MPWAPIPPCTHPLCDGFAVYRGKCEKHRAQLNREIDSRRGSAASRGYDQRWQAARKQYLSENPLCAACRKLGLVIAASVVDHIIPHKGNKQLFWDRSNWQSMCKPCHDVKTAKEDGGFGNKERHGNYEMPNL